MNSQVVQQHTPMGFVGQNQSSIPPQFRQNNIQTTQHQKNPQIHENNIQTPQDQKIQPIEKNDQHIQQTPLQSKQQHQQNNIHSPVHQVNQIQKQQQQNKVEQIETKQNKQILIQKSQKDNKLQISDGQGQDNNEQYQPSDQQQQMVGKQSDDQYNDDQQGGQQQQQQKKQQQFLTDKQIDPMQQYLNEQMQMIAWVNQNSTQWVDHSFPCDVGQFYKQKLPQWASQLGTIQWKRPHQLQKQVKFMDRQGDIQVKQGVFAQSWFLGALMTVASKPQMLQKLIVSSEYFDKGFVTFQFFKNGKWVQVTVDTLLPYQRQGTTKNSVYSCCANSNQFWVQLMQKAFCKLHGSYESICKGSITQGLVDLTGGVSETFKLTTQQQKKAQHNNQIWHNLMMYFHQKYYISCIYQVPSKSAKNAQTGHSGILQNHFYTIMDIRDLSQWQLKLIRIRNPYGNQGIWTGPFSQDSQDWDKHKYLKDNIKPTKISKKPDGSWWMSFSDWLQNYSTVYIGKVFPQTWQSYSIQSKWQGKTYGGPCPQELRDQKKKKNQQQKIVKRVKVKESKKSMQEIKNKKVKPLHQQPDTDDRWFNNPQFRIKVTKDTRLYVSLMLQDQKLSKQPYIQTNFLVIINKNRNNRIWESPSQQQIINQANPGGILPAQRQITSMFTLKKFTGKKFGYYTIIPSVLQLNKQNKKQQKKMFYLRIFASQPIDVVQLPQTLQHTQQGLWSQQSAGGRRKLNMTIQSQKKQKVNVIKQNPSWCKNPQYFINLQKPTHLKIILRKPGNLKRLKNIKPGMTICRFQTPPTPIQIINYKSTKNSALVNNLNRLLQQTAQQLKPPVMKDIQRKLFVTTQQKFKQSTYSLQDYSALYFFWNPTQGPFIIIPSLQQQNKTANFRLTIYSNNPVTVQKLDQTRHAVQVGKWQLDITDGGCHLKSTWLNNPKFLLKFNDLQGQTDLKIKLAIADKNWKKVNANTVKGMIGIYLLQKKQKKQAKLSPMDIIQSTQFLPVHMIQLKLKQKLGRTRNKQGYIIMPCTFQNSIHGSFILSVSSNSPITLTPFK